MKHTITYRQIQRGDHRALEQIISDTWGYERFCSQKTARRMARLYLAGCLAQHTFSSVAVCDGTPVGVILCRTGGEKRPTLVERLAQWTAGAAMLCSREGRAVAKLFQGIDQLDQDLLRHSGRSFDGEVVFFAVGAHQRGLGMGRGLWNDAMEYLRSQCVQQFYLYTDSTCDFAFYEHQGLERVVGRSHRLRPDQEVELQFYLYAGAVEAAPC